MHGSAIARPVRIVHRFARTCYSLFFTSLADKRTEGIHVAVRLNDAFAAAQSGDWERAHSLLSRLADSGDALPAKGLELLAFSTFRSTGELGEACRLMEKAFVAFMAEGDRNGAVMCTTWLVCLYEVAGAEAAIRGWEQRGRRLVEDLKPCVEEGYLALSRTGCTFADPIQLEQSAELALTRAVEFGDRDLELRARAEKGLALVSQGFVNAGFTLLDEVMASIMGGEFRDADMRCRSICSVLSACERVGDIGRVEYWCGRIEQDPYLQHPVLLSHCRMVYGVAEALRGQWARAEAHLVYAMEAETSGYIHKAESAAKLAEIRVHQGRFHEAAALLEGFEDAIEAVPVLARLRLWEGRTEHAAALLRSAIRSLGHDALRLAPLLSLAVEVDLLRDEPAAAAGSLERLHALDARCESNEIRAHLRLSAGRIARHKREFAAAAEEFETALALLIHYDRPRLNAHIRLELARALSALGESAAAVVETEAALATFRRTGMTNDAATAQELLRTFETAAHSGGHDHQIDRSAATDAAVLALTPREKEVASLVARGLTNREIADLLVLSVRTVEGHIDRVLGKLDLHTRTQLAVRLEKTLARSTGPM